MDAREQDAEQPDHLGWKQGWVQQRDGKGGWTARSSQVQFLHWDDIPYWSDEKQLVVPYGVAQMDNGEILLAGAVGNEASEEKPIVATSADGGASWTGLRIVDDAASGRPMSLTYLGNGRVTFAAGYEDRTVLFFSDDFGHTWPEHVPLPINDYGESFTTEGNYLADRDANGVAERLAGFAVTGRRPTDYPFGPFIGGVRWSEDGGRSWSEATSPEAWRWEAEWDGASHERGVSEGSLVRAHNGWIVAALRTDNHPRFFPVPEDNYSGIGVSISQDDGATWSPIEFVHQAGRHHAHLLAMPDGTLVMTFAMRMDIRDGRLASYQRACCALTSRDNGLTWDTEREYLVHSFDFSDGTFKGYSCGHAYSTLLDDGAILSSYMNLPSKGACLVKWTV